MTDKERLENMSPIGFDLGGNVLLKSEDYHWLMEQAERVEELEKINYDLKSLYIHLEKTTERYKQALEFYADEEIYKENLITKADYDADGICISNDEYAPPIIYFDRGEKARKTLKGE